MESHIIELQDVVPKPHVALVTMPWAYAWMPSIQLMVLRQCLDGIATHDSLELNLDFAAFTYQPLYKQICESGGVTQEWIFAEHFFAGEGYVMKDGYLEVFPPIGLESREVERKVISVMAEMTGEFLEQAIEIIDWSQYDIVAFTLTIYQTTASLALSRLIRLKYPRIKIVFGGNSCAGEAARALLEISPYIDVVVQAEAEQTFAAIVTRQHKGEALDGIKGIAYRTADGEVTVNDAAGLYMPHRKPQLPNYDEYFERFRALRIQNFEDIEIPFESSRGCWWGEKSQCTFCGLHEIMKYRVRSADDVIGELDYLHERYGVSQFFATDLILPQEYYKNFLPTLAKRKKKYQLFYELKANVSRKRLKLLADAGLKRLQPGLESLSSKILKQMKKGMSATHVVQFLKWAEEFEIKSGWNIIIGLPQEDPQEIANITKLIPTLYHLEPPGVADFMLMRFSPIFDHPDGYGVRNVKPWGIFNYIYPIEESQLCTLAYHFEFEEISGGGLPHWFSGQEEAVVYQNLRRAVDGWEAAHARGAQLIQRSSVDGSTISDTRFEGKSRVFELSDWQTKLYDSLDRHVPRKSVVRRFEKRHSDLYFALADPGAQVSETLDLWIENRLVFEEAGYVVSVSVRETESHS